ncbi:ABC transporter permease [Thermoanaerobacterium sp. PSU-2]|uniref:carbohydrate ABC transporter permease n=1 Tax=Thermoanaerobacterium sp. PSU-2 TaxID=1930849 RepID=UPI000A1587D9|nr:carbohydrate ABC transporter permease [Thermoanaerobacterium sp. PSU-2]ORX22690.1 ABC transporter permease [Thermoanaerobacterium sp. PSU-2]HHV75174.1 carbohydrate ABC transporter permease [Thermoanaerobacterium sp.]
MKKINFPQLFLHIFLLMCVATMIVPFLYMISTALTKDTYVMPYPPILIPKTFYTGNFKEAWLSNNFFRYFLNSLYISVISTVLSLFIATLSAYGFARFSFPGKEILFNVYLFTMMVPGVLNIVAQYTVINGLHLVDTYSGLLLLYVGTGIAGNTFFLRGFFESIPKELEESIIIDGGTRWTIYRHVILPLSKPALATFAIFAFEGTWDEFFVALTFIKTEIKRTLPIAIMLFQGEFATKWGLVFAASLIAVVPVILIFVVFQKYFIRGGIQEGAIKG